jgi:serine/threonine-protein kinase
MAKRHISWEFAEGQEIVPGRLAVQLLGGGDRAEAWLSWDTSLNTLVVVKILRPNFVGHERPQRALAREAGALRALQHPSIVRLFDAVLVGERPHLVLESLDGPRLATLTHTYGPLTPEQLVPLGLEVFSALAFMHNRGYVHLDVKPRNIVMSASPKLIDLGMARTAPQLARLTTPVGTAAYMAPEQCSVETLPAIGPPADVWGLGATLYEALSGQPPFPRPTPELRYPQVGMTASAPHWAPGRIADIVMSCLAPKPEMRPTAAEAFEQLASFADEARMVAGRRLRTRYRR